MAEEPSGAKAKRGARLPRFSDLLDVTDEMIVFADTYQKVWESEGRAVLALGEFLTARSESLRHQVTLMRMGNDAFRRYSQWSEAIFGIRPETFMTGLLDRFRAPDRPPAE